MMTEPIMPDISRGGHANRPKNLRQKHYRRLREDIETIFTLARKIPSYEILDIKNKGVKLRKT